MAGKYRTPRQTVIKNYEVLVSDTEGMRTKANELIADGMYPWGPPSFLFINGSLKCCQAFVKKEQVKLAIKEE